MLHYHWEHCRECDGIQLIDQWGRRAPGNPSNLPSSDRDALCSCPAAERSGPSDSTGVDEGTLRVWFQRS